MTIWRWLREQWRAFRKSAPGERFKELYRRRERTPHAKLKKALFLAAGVLAIVTGIVTYAIPLIPSDPFILFGIAAIAQASRVGARLLDWLELRLHGPFRVAYRIWQPLPRWASRPCRVRRLPAIRRLAQPSARRQLAGGTPNSRLNARPNAASDS
jgi:hypothetical protein